MDPIAVVTGGSRGIGAALVREFAITGRRTLAIARNGVALEQVRAQLPEDARARVTTLALDLTAPDAIDRIMDRVAADGAFVDTLVNNAANILGEPLAEIRPEACIRLINLNITAGTVLMNRVIPGMIARSSGQIVNVASIAAVAPTRRMAIYGASKAYMKALTHAAQLELSGTGVSVHLLVPGPVETDMLATARHANGLAMTLMPVATPELVARATIDGLAAGRSTIAPGLINWVLFHSSQWLAPVIVRGIYGTLARDR